ncbi:hypothetical protein ACJMK2_026679 [Sinanodonta woodiana]|uniref:EGF-like domain-containing protein n=1 Tax=Sinanodonta woodiana TaxID=1069815 RepID=A0ABD3XKN6_SINWO
MIEKVNGGVPIKYSGPNVCVDREHGYVCCTGWKISLLTGLCVISSVGETEANICVGSPCQQKCVVADGHPSCTCMPGFYLRLDGVTCGDIDECQRYPFLCEQTCRNTIGSYMCTCYSNFTLTNNGRTCRRIHDYSWSPCTDGAISNGACGENSYPASNSNTEQPTEKRYVEDHHPFDNQQLLGGFPFKKGITQNTEVDVSCGDGMPCFSAVSPRECSGNQCDNTREIPVVDIQRGDCSTDDCLTSLYNGFVPLQEHHHQASLCPNNEPCVIPYEKSQNSMDCKGSNCLHMFDLNFLHSSPIKDQPPREKVAKSDSREKKGRGGNMFASDDVMCRGDLCNDPARQKQLLATHDPKTPLKIPLKTWTVLRTTSTETPLTIRVKTSSKTSVRKSSNTPVKTPSKKFSFCPIGYRPVTRGEFDFCEPLPELDLKRGASNKKESLVQCEDGQQLIITPEGQTCEKMHVKQVCPKGQLPMFVEDGIECVQLGKMGKMSACPPGYTPKAMSDGIVCQFPDVESVPKCPKGRIPILSDSGLVCVNEAVPQPLCPDGFEMAEGDDGLVCVAVDVCPSGEVAVEKGGGGMICQLMSTESSCPAGLIPVETHVGRLCQYVPPADVPPAEFQIVECPMGQVRVFHHGEATCVDANGAIKCSPGQVLVETDSGVFCGFTPESCPPGQIEINGPSGMECQKYDSRTHNVNPCPPDQELDQTGEIPKCRYRQNRNKGLQTTELCGNGQVLKLFPRRFVCEQDILASARRQCSLGTHVAIHNNEYICITDTEARMTCEEDEILTATGGTFSCLSNNDISILPICGPGEIPNENGQTKKCVRVEEGRALCNDGYKAVPTEDGFICKSIKLQLECPPGFILTLQKGLPTCAGQTDIDCRTDDRIKNDCVSTEPTLNPCADGYLPIEMDETYECWLEGEHPPPCGEEDGDRIRPCDIRLEDLKLQCNPECANGGRCNNGTCICPDGITGTACQTDIDECVLLPNGHCEFRCENHFGGFSCVCPAGSTLNTDDRTCKGINCVPGCLNGGTCIRDRCACPPGLTGDRCQHDTTCIPACKNGGRCENHKCVCPEGYQGVICQLDVNECYHGQPCSHMCQNTRGSFRCTCPTGYILDDDARTCEVISITKSTSSP